jgi:two-component system, NtrC family, response regulator AtoC
MPAACHLGFVRSRYLLDGYMAISLDCLTEADFVLGTSPAIQLVNAVVADVANTDIPVLLFGESGTGKDAYAALIHSLSARREKLLTKINCMTANSSGFLEQVQTALEPAASPERAGSLFLAEIEELDLEAQRALLSCLRDAEASAMITGPRLICSTSKDPAEETAAGRFRRELYFRVNGVCINLPALRDRQQDILALFDLFVARHAKALGRKPPVLDDHAMELLGSYHWPGNIRELENVAKKLVVFGSADIALQNLRCATQLTSPAEKAPLPSLKLASRTASRRAEREMILKALENTRWNRKRAAQQLQVSYKSLLYKIKQLEVQNSDSHRSVTP